MNAKIDDVMIANAIVATPDVTVGEIRRRMLGEEIHALPVVSPEGEPIGIVTSTDLVAEPPADTPVAHIMSTGVFTVPRYADVHIAARIMRNHGLHHVVVTHEKQVVGIVSSFDLIKLVEDHRFVMKNGPTEPRRRSPQRS